MRQRPRTLVAFAAVAGLVVLGGCAAPREQGALDVDAGAAPTSAAPAPTSDPAPAPSPDTSPQPIGTAGTPDSQVDPFVPSTLVLPSGTRMPVEPSGVDDEGLLVVPAHPSRAGWWTGGASAGDPFGGIVVAGHVDTARFGIGAMAGLRDARQGEAVELRAGERVARYEVARLVSVPKARLSAELEVFRQDVPGRLVLITCGGEFDPVSGHYEDNVVVIAEPVPG